MLVLIPTWYINFRKFQYDCTDFSEFRYVYTNCSWISGCLQIFPEFWYAYIDFSEFWYAETPTIFTYGRGKETYLSFRYSRTFHALMFSCRKNVTHFFSNKKNWQRLIHLLMDVTIQKPTSGVSITQIFWYSVKASLRHTYRRARPSEPYRTNTAAPWKIKMLSAQKTSFIG